MSHHLRGSAATLLLLVLAGCSAAAPGGPSVGARTPVPSAAGPSLASPSGPSTAPAGGLTGAPITLTRGSAHVALTGGASLAFDLTLGSGILVPGTNVILGWSGPPDGAARDDGLRIQAPSAAGVYHSSGDAFGAPSIHVSTGRIGTAGVPPRFAPTRDECTVILTKVDATGVDGSLTCAGLTASGYDKPVDVQATFTAAP